MLNWAVVFLVLGLIAGILGLSGFSGVGGASMFMLMSAFFILTLTGVMMIVAWRSRRKLT